MHGRAIFLLASATVFVGCGGGGGSGSSSASSISVIPVTASPTPGKPSASPTPVGTPTPPASTAVSAAITAATGGSLSATLNGQTVTLTVPAGALSQSATVTLSIYAKAGLPRIFQSNRRKAQALPPGTTFVTGMGITTGSATLLQPLSFSVAGAPNLTAGSVVRLAASTQTTFGDVDTATQTNGTINEANNPAYAGVSLAGPSIVYAFYSVGAANALPPPAITVSVAGPTSVVGGSQAQYSGGEADVNGFPLLTSSYTYAIDSATLGTMTAAGALSAAVPVNNASGHVVATDSRTTQTGSLPITVLSSRPATAGDSLSYAGTLTSSIANNAIAASPVSSTQTASVAQTIAVGAGASSGQVVVSDNESDTFQLSTLTTHTTSTLAYTTATAAATSSVRLLQSTATDSNNATYETQYTPTSGLLTVEPETAGTFGPNDASQTYTETDPGVGVGASGQNVTTTRTTAASGAYSETTTNADGSTNKAIQNADGTGSYAIPSATDEGPVQLTFGAPTAGTTTTIPITFVASSRNLNQTLQAPLWYPASPLALYAETDTIAPASAYDPRCSVPAKYGTASAKVTEAITSVDAVFGNLENQTTTTYDVDGVGTVCSIFTDTTQTFYDYTGQETNFITFNTTASPILSSTVTEVLSITAGTISGQPVSTASTKRATSSLSRLAVIVGRERFRHAVRKAKVTQAVRMANLVRRLQGVR